MKKLVILLGILLVALNGYSQVRIDTVIVNIAASPSTARVKLTTSDFILKGITLSSLNDTNNTQVVSIFYKMPQNCGQVLIS